MQIHSVQGGNSYYFIKSLYSWLIVVLMSLIPILVVDIFKLFRINTTRDERNN